MQTLKHKFFKIWMIALPIVVQGIVFQIQSLTDKAFLGNIDSKYLSALGASQAPFYTTMDTVFALMTGVVILSSQAYGAKEWKQAKRYTLSGAAYGSVITLFVFLMWFFMTENILTLFRVDPIILPYGVEYIKICSFSFLLLGLDSALQAMLQGYGNTKPILICGLAKVVLNFVISYILIFGKLGLPALELAGAAYGTLIANIVSSLLLFIYCFVVKKEEYELCEDVREHISFNDYKTILKIGVPTALEYFLWNASNLVLMAFLNSMSYQATAIYTLTFGIEVIVYMVFNGTGKASMSLIGQDIGAGDYHSADDYMKLSVGINVILVSICTGIFYLYGNLILGIFTKDSTLIEKAAVFLVFSGFIMFPKSINVIIGNGIRAYKDAKWMLYSQIFGSIFVVSFSFLLVYVFKLGIWSIYITLFCDEALRAFINLVHYVRKHSSANKVSTVNI